MSWYGYLTCFVSGLFLANCVPHLIAGICGRRFPTPFAKPPGKGLSSAVVNVIWGLLNLGAGIALAQVEGHPFFDWISNMCFFAGLSVMALILGIYFQRLYSKEF